MPNLRWKIPYPQAVVHKSVDKVQSASVSPKSLDQLVADSARCLSLWPENQSPLRTRMPQANLKSLRSCKGAVFGVSASVSWFRALLISDTNASPLELRRHPCCLSL